MQPQGDGTAERNSGPAPLLEVTGLVKHFPIRRGFFGRTVGHVHAVDGVSLRLDAGKAIGLVGESGCGKTTTGRCIIRLIEPTRGSIKFMGTELMGISQMALRPLRPKLQMVFQDPIGSLNPRMSIGAALTEPMLVHRLYPRDEMMDRAAALLTKVGLQADHLYRFPHEFSGGQRQRVGIARALCTGAKLIILDEPVSALDVSVQAQVINLLKDLQDELGLGYVFIAHDLAVVAHVCDTVAVMYLGEIVEQGPTETVLGQPLHPYTQALLSAVPTGQPGQRRARIILPGDPPSPLEPSSAKRFVTRFPTHAAAFAEGEISLRDAGGGHVVRCARLDVLQQLAKDFQASYATAG